jgi:nonsense-mediated mRNA decay protein 3
MNCIKCGSETKLYENLCSNCFVEDNKFSSLPGVINVTLCPTCNARLKSRHWESSSSIEESIELTVEDHIKLDPKIGYSHNQIEQVMRDRHITDVMVECDFHFDDLPIKENHKSEVRLKFEQCDICSKIAASYFTSIIQVRADERTLTDTEIDEILDRIGGEVERLEMQDRSVFISKVENMHGGFDIYISKQSAARQIIKTLLSRYGGTTSSSPSLVGQKDGKDIHRITFLIRLPKYQHHDVVNIDGKLFLIRRISSRKLDVIDLFSWEKTSLSSKNLKRLKVLAKKADLHEAQIVSMTASELQVLDTRSYKTYDVMIPKNYSDIISGSVVDLSEIKIYIIFNEDEEPVLIPSI